MFLDFQLAALTKTTPRHRSDLRDRGLTTSSDRMISMWPHHQIGQRTRAVDIAGSTDAASEPAASEPAASEPAN